MTEYQALMIEKEKSETQYGYVGFVLGVVLTTAFFVLGVM